MAEFVVDLRECEWNDGLLRLGFWWLENESFYGFESQVYLSKVLDAFRGAGAGVS